ncbi:MAG: Na(+)-translocating NADH-quinone reductase subunit C [Gammaproteobacteria bacterium]|jgi:Na+-transporting NADH:ubiquinone oxidoreductase subunit C|nr:Na(+)-translocating NADH-quinone reductase subunit C [Gammaproteobacteria bacterium]
MSQPKRDGIGNILLVAVSVCLVCSILVSGAAVALKPVQKANRVLDQKKNVLIAAGVLAEGATEDAAGRGVEALFADFETRVVDLRTGRYAEDVDAQGFDQLRTAADPSRSTALATGEDPATIKRLEHYGLVYLKRDESGAIETAVLPIRGYGLWGTLYGYLALDSDLETVAGIGFYQHQETPGLGGEVENPRWKAQWAGVSLFGDDGAPAVALVKGKAPEGSDARSHQVDALSGATMTSRGVQNLVNFWVGERGYGTWLENMRGGRV